MLTELALVPEPVQRWRFAWNCSRIALFQPGPGGATVNRGLGHWLAVFGVAAASALHFAGPGAILIAYDRPLRLAQWLVLSVVFALIAYRPEGDEPSRMKTWLFTYCRAAIFGLVSSTSFAFLEVGKYPGIRSGEVAFSFPLFHGLELLSTMLFLAATPIVRGFRAGDSVLARPISLVVRVAFMVLVATGWFFLLTDQMPCFREIPNCD